MSNKLFLAIVAAIMLAVLLPLFAQKFHVCMEKGVNRRRLACAGRPMHSRRLFGKRLDEAEASTYSRRILIFRARLILRSDGATSQRNHGHCPPKALAVHVISTR